MYEKNPFGNPDGAQSDIEDLNDNFIDITPPALTAGTMNSNFTSIRIIVGEKGSGKTHYMRILRRRIKEKSSYSAYIDGIKNMNGATEEIIRFSYFYNNRIISEKWEMIWKCAIYASVMSHLLNSDDLKEMLVNEDIDTLNFYKRKLNISIDYKQSVYDCFKNFISYIDTRNKMDAFLNNSVWLGVEMFLLDHLRNLKPIYFFLDAIDEEYEHAPQFWLRCQKGLFYAVMHLLREDVFRERLHIIICIRSMVYASVLRSEHQMKYINEPHIFTLNWTRNNLEYLLKKKIEKLKDCYFILESEQKSLYSWLSIETIDNKARGISENLVDYILRHTRQVPRDVIQICNSLAEIKMLYNENNGINLQEEIRKRINVCAKAIGDELLTICAKQVVIEEMPRDRNVYRYSSAFTEQEEMSNSRFTLLQEVLGSFQKDYFNDEDLTLINKMMAERIDSPVSLIDILWLNRALGYISNGIMGQYEVFYNQDYRINSKIPRCKEEYILSSCICDSLEFKSVKKYHELNQKQ